MELIGDIERAFASAIYPNRVPIAIGGVIALAALGVLARHRRLDLVARRNPRRSVAVVAVAAVVLGPIAWYLGSPLFLTSTVDEQAPIVATASPTSPPTPRPSGQSTPPATEPPASAAPSPAVVLIERTGNFTGADDFHFGSGRARLIETSPGSFTVRLEEFAVRNGPDLYVYLSPSAKGYSKGVVELGRLKADRGNQNYGIPPGTDVSRAASVVIWCRQFSVLFATAPLE